CRQRGQPATAPAAVIGLPSHRIASLKSHLIRVNARAAGSTHPTASHRAPLGERGWLIGQQTPSLAAMFTGIVTDVGEVREARRSAGGLTLVVATAYDTAAIALGASIGCSGVCLTAIALKPGELTVEISGETLARSTLGDWRAGTRINLEQSLKLGDEKGGHLVLGHVDGVARVVERRPEGDSVRF